MTKTGKSSQSVKLSKANSSSSQLIHYSIKALKSTYEKGQSYKKARVYVSGITLRSSHEQTLFATTNHDKQKKVTALMDEINQKMGRNTLKLAAMRL